MWAKKGGEAKAMKKNDQAKTNAEQKRLQEAREENVPWKKWGRYLFERQWGTAREDDSEGGDAWNFLTHDHARSRAYRSETTDLCDVFSFPSATGV